MMGVFKTKKEIRVSIQTHPIASAENTFRRIYVSFADVARLDGDGGVEHRIGCRVEHGGQQYPDLYGEG
jgi:hypothetical protein